MVIVRDEPKRLTNMAKPGLDFADHDTAFFLSSLVIPAQADRHMAIGRRADGTIAVVFALLGAEVISMRPSAKPEFRR